MINLRETAEFVSCEYRQCLVHNEKALFHRWVDKDGVIYKSNVMFRDAERIKQIKSLYEATGVLPYNMDVEKVRNTVAIVEFEDGTVEMVNPTDIHFIDGSKMFQEVSWD